MLDGRLGHGATGPDRRRGRALDVAHRGVGAVRPLAEHDLLVPVRAVVAGGGGPGGRGLACLVGLLDSVERAAAPASQPVAENAAIAVTPVTAATAIR